MLVKLTAGTVFAASLVAIATSVDAASLTGVIDYFPGPPFDAATRFQGTFEFDPDSVIVEDSGREGFVLKEISAFGTRFDFTSGTDIIFDGIAIFVPFDRFPGGTFGTAISTSSGIAFEDLEYFVPDGMRLFAGLYELSDDPLARYSLEGTPSSESPGNYFASAIPEPEQAAGLVAAGLMAVGLKFKARAKAWRR